MSRGNAASPSHTIVDCYSGFLFITRFTHHHSEIVLYPRIQEAMERWTAISTQLFVRMPLLRKRYYSCDVTTRTISTHAVMLLHRKRCYNACVVIVCAIDIVIFKAHPFPDASISRRGRNPEQRRTTREERNHEEREVSKWGCVVFRVEQGVVLVFV